MTTGIATTSQADQVANPDSTPDTVRLLKFLQDLPKRDSARVLSGQTVASVNLEFDEYYQRYIVQLRNETGETPAIMGVGYAWEEVVPEAISNANRRLIEHWKEGGIVTVSMSPNNPFTNGGVKDFSIGGRDYSEIFTPGTEPYKRWRNTLSGIADGLEELRDAGVVVMWRPLHEANGDFFWWSFGQNDERVSAEDYTRLWRDMFDYFSGERKLNNLLWVFAPNVQVNDIVKPVTYYYPGDRYVDIVGLDYYDNSLDGLNINNSYSDLVSTGKPIGLTEVGPAFWFFAHPRGKYDTRMVVETIRNRFPEIRFFAYWHGWSSFMFKAKMGIVENAHYEQMFQDPWVVTRDSLNWRKAR